MRYSSASPPLVYYAQGVEKFSWGAEFVAPFGRNSAPDENISTPNPKMESTPDLLDIKAHDYI